MTKIISYQYLRNEIDISQNIEDKQLDNPIKWAQDQLRFLLGTAFYNEIVGQYPSSLSTDNNALYDPYIKQFLAHQAYEYYMPKANYQSTRSGFRKFTEDNSEAVNDSELGTLIRLQKEKTQFYKNEMIMFIKQEQRIDSSKYPLYRDCGVKAGSGFHITSITAKDNSSKNINRKIFNNE